MILQRHVINTAGVKRRDHSFFSDVTELRNFGAFTVRQIMFTAAKQYIRLNAQRRQLTHAMLRWLGLKLPSGRDIGDQRYMD